MRSRFASLSLVASLVLAAVAARAQAPPPAGTQAAAAPQPAPTIEQMRTAVSRLRSSRIAVPANFDALTPEQQAYVKSILTGPRSDISGPLGVMMVSPGLGDLSQKAMAYARFAGREGFSSVPVKLNELAILVVAKHWMANYVWNAHADFAVRQGIPQGVVDAILAGRRPARMEKDVEAIYDFASEFMTSRRVSDGTLTAARTVLNGDRGVVDLVGTMGLYQLTSMMVALDQTPLPAGVKPYFN